MAIVPRSLDRNQSSASHRDHRIGAIYARVSTQDQKDSGYSLDIQVAAGLAWAQKHHVQIPPDFIFKEDYTGVSLNRPDLRTLRTLVTTQAIAVAIVYAQDRLSRKLAHQLLLYDEFEQAGVLLHVVGMPENDSSPESQLFTTIHGAFAEYERLKILTRTKNGWIGRAQAGFVPGGMAPLGYTRVQNIRPQKGAHWEVNEEEASLVRLVFQLYLTEGLTIVAIAKRFTLLRIPTVLDRRGKGPARRLAAGVWHPSCIREILNNESYIGTMYYGKTESLPGKKNPDKRTRQRTVPREEWIAVTVPALIDPQTFAKAQEQLERNARLSTRNQKRPYLLGSGRLRCTQCGGGMSGQYNPRKNWRYYRCTHYRWQQENPCHGTVHADKIEAHVWERVERVLRNPAIVVEHWRSQQQGAAIQQDHVARERAFFRTELMQCDKDTKRWEAAYLAEAIDVDDFKTKKAELATRQASATQELVRLDEEQRQIEHFLKMRRPLCSTARSYGLHCAFLTLRKNKRPSSGSKSWCIGIQMAKLISVGV